ncbi:PREDICTED: reverse mRNAase [Prunus dulcis]|uniref:PREDICTED: reverse mRNAase n=1 Tax=Prunus dulcis TaxID=3755 RepID=A0A5E4G9X3_PRUDU|nr:PREDICTED: reverse mRNAase [Prunus dulcis]
MFFLKNYRLTKRVRASKDLAPERVLDSNFSPTLTPYHKQGTNSFPSVGLEFGTRSFRDKPLGNGNLGSNVGIDGSCLDDAYEDRNNDEDAVISRDERGPCIQFSVRAMDHLCKPWKNALIIKLLGRSQPHNYLKARLQQKWSLKGDWKLVDLVNDYFVVKFDINEDLNFVLTGGPWIIVRQYLRIGNLLGKLLKIDSLTTAQNRGKFATLCAELDLTKPLEAFVQINQNCQELARDACVGTEAGKGSRTNKLVEEGLRGPWMVVPPRRNTKPNFAAGGGKSSDLKAKGSHFDALKNHNKKWTKSKSTKADPRSALNDILNKVASSKSLAVVNEKKGGDQNVHNEEGVYIFGHQPSNIKQKDETLEVSSDFENEDVNFGVSASESLEQDERIPCGHKRDKLWDYLNFVAECHQLPWLLAGDFNEMLNIDDKFGGAVVNRLKGFKTWVHNNDMVDMGFSRPRFTWQNNIVFEIQDCAMCNLKWRQLFADANQPSPKTFRFEAMWMQHDTFGDFIASIWGQSAGSALHKTLKLIEPLKIWNVNEGDRHTKFFHLTTIIRRRWNKIERLKYNKGVLVEEAENIKAFAVEFFMELFNQPSSDGFVDVIPNLFPRLETVELSALNKVVDMAEVKDSLFSIGGLKAPRMDGFPACFYQNQWGQYAFDIFGIVVQVFTDCHVLNKLNSTLITLVPIVVSPQSPILPKLISHRQVRFVPGRHITGNILLAQELMHKYKIVKGKKSFVAWKIDMSKDYHRLSWKFIK